MGMQIQEIDKLFITDEEGRFINLIIPKDVLGDTLNLKGRKMLDLTLDEIVRVKKYANKLYEEAE